MSFGVVAGFVANVRTIVDGLRWLAKLPGWFRRRRDALPVIAAFGFTGDSLVDADGVRWDMVWLENTGSRAYLHDVYWTESVFGVVFPETSPQVAKVGELGSLPRELRSLSKRELQHKEGMFKPQHLSAGKRVQFYVSCPREVAMVKMGATMSIGRRGSPQYVDSEWLDVPNADGGEWEECFPSW